MANSQDDIETVRKGLDAITGWHRELQRSAQEALARLESELAAEKEAHGVTLHGNEALKADIRRLERDLAEAGEKLSPSWWEAQAQKVGRLESELAEAKAGLSRLYRDGIARLLALELSALEGELATLNDFHRANYERQHEVFAPPHPLMALVACVQEEVGELASAVLGMTGEKKRKAHLTRDDVLDAVADAMTYLSLVASNVGCFDLEELLGRTFNMVSDRAGSKIKTRLGSAPPAAGQGT